MDYFTVTYRYRKAVVLFRKRRDRSDGFSSTNSKTETATFMAENLMQALTLAKAEGEIRFHRQRWTIESCKKLCPYAVPQRTA